MKLDQEQEKLEAEYLALLNRYGLQPIQPVERPAKTLRRLREMARDGSPTDLRNYSLQTIELVDALNEKTGGKVEPALLERQVYDGTGELDQSVTKILSVLQSRRQQLDLPVYINVFPTGEFNACAKPTPNGVLCLLNTGLLRLLHRVAVACCYPVHSTKNGISFLEGEPKREIPAHIIGLSSVVRVILRYQFEGNLKPQMAKDTKLDPWGMIVATAINFAMEAFVVAHEVGHGVLGHTNIKHLRQVLTPHGHLESLSPSHRQEYEADLWAHSVLIESDKVKGHHFPLACGGLCFLTVHLMLLEVISKITNQKILSERSSLSHPTSTDRMRALHKEVREMESQEYKANTLQLWALLWRILEIIQSSNIQMDKESITVQTPEGCYTIREAGFIPFTNIKQGKDA